MRTTQLLVAAVILLAVTTHGCADRKNPAAPAAQGLELHVTTSFANDHVAIALDDCQVFGGSATTDDRLGLSFIVHTTACAGSHSLEVNVGEHSRRLQFELQGYTYLIVHRDPQTGELSILATGERPIYD
jgi:hypothetical protein